MYITHALGCEAEPVHAAVDFQPDAQTSSRGIGLGQPVQLSLVMDRCIQLQPLHLGDVAGIVRAGQHHDPLPMPGGAQAQTSP